MNCSNPDIRAPGCAARFAIPPIEREPSHHSNSRRRNRGGAFISMSRSNKCTTMILARRRAGPARRGRTRWRSAGLFLIEGERSVAKALARSIASPFDTGEGMDDSIAFSALAILGLLVRATPIGRAPCSCHSSDVAVQDFVSVVSDSLRMIAHAILVRQHAKT